MNEKVFVDILPIIPADMSFKVGCRDTVLRCPLNLFLRDFPEKLLHLLNALFLGINDRLQNRL